MIRDDYATDYQTENLVKIKIWGFDYWVTPRFVKLYVEQLYEPVSARLVLSILAKASKGEVWVDAGAHYGFYSLLAASRFPKLQTLAVEPMAENVTVIRRNIRVNHYKSIEVIEAAVSSKLGEKEIMVAHASDSSSFAPHPTGKKIGTRIIKTTTLDEITKNKGVALIKLDVEGHELPALYGAVKTIKKNNPAIIFEYHPVSQRLAGFGNAEALEFLINKDYRLWAVSESQKKLITLNHSPTLAHTQALDAFGHEGYGNILALPIESQFVYDSPFPIPGSTTRKLKLQDSGIGMTKEMDPDTDWNNWWLQHERDYYKLLYEQTDWEVKEFKKKWIYRVGQKIKKS